MKKKHQGPDLFAKEQRWTFPSSIVVLATRVPCDQNGPTTARYETYVNRRIRLAFQCYFNPEPLGKKAKNPRPIWVGGVYCVDPQFTVSTSPFETFDACLDDLRKKLKVIRTGLAVTREL